MSARDALDKAMSEAELQRAVTDMADAFGWLWHHAGDSRRSTAGLPDLILVRPPRVIAAELKTHKGRLRNEQTQWLDMLGRCPGVETYVWRPGDLRGVEMVLR